MPFRLAPFTLLLLLTGSAVLAQEPIAALEKKYRELRADSSGKDNRQAISEVGKALSTAREELEAAVVRGSLRELRRELAAGFDPSIQNNLGVFLAAVCEQKVPAVRLLVGAASEPLKLFVLSSVDAPWNCVARNNNRALARAVLEAAPPRDWSREITEEAIRDGAFELFELTPTNAIPRAVELGHIRLARSLLFATDHPGRNFASSLNMAVQKGDPIVVQRLLTMDPDGTLLTDRQRANVFSYAVGFAAPEIIRPLLDAGAEPTREILDKAAGRDEPEVLRALVTGGVDPWQAMAAALRQKARNALGALLQDTVYAPRGVSIREVGRRQLAQDLLAGGLDPAHQRYLIAGGAFDVEARDAEGRTGLIRAARAGDVPLAELYLQAGADPDGKDYQQRTALLVAAHRQDVPLMKVLREAGASDEPQGQDGRTPAAEFWAGFEQQRYQRLDGKAGLSFSLPTSFATPCHDSAKSGAGKELECSGKFEMEVVITARNSTGAWVRQLMASLHGGEQEEFERSAEAGTSSIRGRKGAHLLTVTARGPEALAPELQRVATMAWRSLTPLESAAAKNAKYLICLLLLVLLIALLASRRRRLARRASDF